MKMSEPPLLLSDWKPDVSSVPIDVRFQGSFLLNT